MIYVPIFAVIITNCIMCITHNDIYNVEYTIIQHTNQIRIILLTHYNNAATALRSTKTAYQSSQVHCAHAKKLLFQLEGTSYTFHAWSKMTGERHTLCLH